jgi:hypothetical protein
MGKDGAKRKTLSDERQIQISRPHPSGQDSVESAAKPAGDRPFHDLQRSAGNQAMLRLLESGGIQASLRVSQPGDPAEMEAERVAERVVASQTVHRKCNCEGGGASCPACEEEEVEQAKGIHRKAQSASGPDTSASGELTRVSGTGQPLEPAAREMMESRFQHDFSRVRVHTGEGAAESARAINARAYTVDQNIVFDAGAYEPGSRDGQKLLAHELAHVVQQSGKSQKAHVQRAADTATEPQKKQEPGFFEKIGHGIAGAASSVWHGLEGAGKAVWKGMKAVGHGIATAAGEVWKGLKWLGLQLVDKIAGAFERVMHWITRLPERVARLVVGLWEGVKSLRPWALDWWASLAKISTWVGFLEWLGTRILELAELLGVGEILETISDFLKFNTRKLTSKERSAAASVFGDSINFELVRIDSAGLSVWIAKKLKGYSEGRPFTTLHTINGLGGLGDDTLIHELTHVWQYQQVGAVYAFQALHAQNTPEGYDYGGAEGLREARDAGKGFASFNREQQAQIVEDYYRIRTGRSPDFGAGTAADLPLYASFVKTVSSLSESELAHSESKDKGGSADGKP